mmetsp:Transcript_45101/g.146822  ORF Transcript_45101/g.146822 Transcript_45101/m.146822 type:complete len:256 (+) Transcript_45101:197-964(+)
MTLAFGSRHTRRLLLPTKRCLRRPPRCRRRRRRSPPRRRRASQRRPSRPSPSLVSTSHPLGWSRTWMRRCLWVGWRSRRWRREAPSATRFAPSVMLRAARSAPSAVCSVRSAGSGRITRLVSRRAQCWSWVSRMRSMPSTRSGARPRRPRQRRRRRRRRRQAAVAQPRRRVDRPDHPLRRRFPGSTCTCAACTCRAPPQEAFAAATRGAGEGRGDSRPQRIAATPAGGRRRSSTAPPPVPRPALLFVRGPSIMFV